MSKELDVIDISKVIEKLERLLSLLLQYRSVFSAVTQELTWIKGDCGVAS